MVEKDVNGAVALWKLPSWTAEELGLTMDAAQLVVPLSSGLPSRHEDAKSLVVVFVTVGWVGGGIAVALD